MTGAERFGWILTETIEVVLEFASEDGTVVTVVEVTEDETADQRRAVLTVTDGDLLFDGERIETEDFMAYLAVVDAPFELGQGRVTLYADNTAGARDVRSCSCCGLPFSAAGELCPTCRRTECRTEATR